MTRVTSAAAAARAAAAGPASQPVTLLVTSPELLTARQLTTLARVPGNRVIAGPDRAVLATLAPQVSEISQLPVRSLAPRCDLPAAQPLGRPKPAAQSCTPSRPEPFSAIRTTAIRR